MKRVGIFEAKTRLSSLVSEILSDGEVFEITKHGRVVAELRPPDPDLRTPRRGIAKGPGFWISDDFDEPI
jgi:antitoxin (DNA-binding transcriptional repressor) of toxin-antitoxin stability system